MREEIDSKQSKLLIILSDKFKLNICQCNPVVFGQNSLRTFSKCVFEKNKIITRYFMST